MRTLLLATGFSVLLVSTALGQTQLPNPGLQIQFAPPGARALGMGATFVAIADDATAAASNPSGLIILSRPEVSRKGVGVAGLSLGGETTMYVAALDERVKVADSSGWLTTIENMKNGHCPCWNFPGLDESFDFSDVFSLIAPRPLVCEIGEQEKAPGGFPVSIAKPAFEDIRRSYKVFGAEKKAVLDIHSGGHVFVGREFRKLLESGIGKP